MKEIKMGSTPKTNGSFKGPYSNPQIVCCECSKGPKHAWIVFEDGLYYPVPILSMSMSQEMIKQVDLCVERGEQTIMTPEGIEKLRSEIAKLELSQLLSREILNDFIKNRHIPEKTLSPKGIYSAFVSTYIIAHHKVKERKENEE